MEKGIGVITFHKSLNYGSALQAWALVQALQSIGAKAEIIDYEPNNFRALYAIYYPPISLTNIKYDYLHLFWHSFLKRREKDFSAFRQQHLPLSPKKYMAGENLSDFINEKDIMIAGSDQIWNPQAKDFDMNFLLPYDCSAKKISYAASIGNGDWEKADRQAELKSCLQSFSALSVREESGAEKLRVFLPNRSINVDLDPTLLHSATVYEKIIEPRIISTPYIFFYSVHCHQDAISAAQFLSQKLRLPVFTLMSAKGNKHLYQARKTIRLADGNAGPSGFLSLAKHANMIITDSFHGVAFSMIYEKDFFAINTRKPDGILKNDERITGILRSLRLEDRYMTLDQIQHGAAAAPLRYADITKRRMEIAEASLNYLKHECECQ